MQEVVSAVADDIFNAFIATSADAAAISRPLLVAIAGIPGSGKTTLAANVAQCIRDMNEENLASSVERGKVVKEAPKYAEAELPDFAPAGGATAAATLVVGDVFVMGMDGYHLYRFELDQLPNPAEAHRCRGAHWTFNPRGMAADLVKLLETGRLDAPSFDHALKDPTPNAIHIDARTNTTAFGDASSAVVSRCIVIVEGLYLALREPAEWATINDLFDFVVFLNCDLEVATQRLVARHMAAWGCSLEEATARAMGSDRANAELVMTTAINAHVEVESVSDPSLA